MTKLKRKIWGGILATVITIGIIGATLGISYLLAKPTQLSMLQATAQNYGTIDLDCHYSENNHTLAVKQRTTYINHTNHNLTEVKFNIYANAYQKDAKAPAVAKTDVADAYPNGFDPGYIKVTTPHTVIDGTDNTVLTVPLTKAVTPGASTQIDLEYTIKLANVKHRLGYTQNAVNLGNFYAIPIVFDNDLEIYPYSYNGDPFYNEPYNFNVTMDAPAGYIIASSGEPVGENQYRGYLLRDFAMVLSRNFKLLTRPVGNTIVKYYYLNDEIPEVSLYTACNALAYFSNQFINYPYSTLSIVQTDFQHGGMEYGTLIYASLDVTDQVQYQTVIVHEIAHQWWYGLVGNNQHYTPWIDEGLAEYSTAVFFETHPQYGRTLESIATENQQSIAMFERIMNDYHVNFSRCMNKYLDEYRLQSEYTINTYARGMLLFYYITDMVGYQNLNQALAQFAQANCFQFGDMYELSSTLEASLGKDLIKYINNYLAGNQPTVV